MSPPLRVGINARILKSPDMRGWARYTVNLIDQLKKMPVDIFLYHREPVNPLFKERLSAPNVQWRHNSSLSYFLWEQAWLPKKASEDQIALLHCPIHFGLPKLGQFKKVLTLHDAIPGYSLSFAGALSWVHHSAAILSTDAIITVSEYSNSEIQKNRCIREGKIKVIPEAADEIFLPHPTGAKLEEIRRKYSLNNPFFFYIGGWEERKNLPFLIDCFLHSKCPGMDLLLAGGSESGISQMKAVAKGSNRIKLLGKISDEDLSCLYRLAKAFVYPSLLEGFGLQVVEAYAAGCPVIGSASSSLAEIISFPEATFDPKDAKSCRKLLEQVANNEGYIEKLKQIATREAKKYSWQLTGNRTYELYKQVVGLI